MIRTVRRPIRFLAIALMLVGLVAAQSGQAFAQSSHTASPPAAMGGLKAATNTIALANASAPSASWTQNGGRIDVFQVFFGTLLQKFWTSGGGWSNWISLGAPAAGVFGNPSATWTSSGSRIDVFVTGNSDGALYQKFWTSGGGWSGWVNLGGVLVVGPSASWTQNGGRIDVFGIGTDFRLYQKFWTSGGGWSNWIGFAAPAAGIGSSPTATWTANGGRLDVFVRGSSDGALYQKFWTSGGGWSGWVNLGGTLISAPSASWTANGGRIDVWGIGTDSRVYQKFWTSGGGWSNWFGFTGPSAGVGSSPSATWTASGSRIDVFVTGDSNGNVYQKFWTSAAGWSGWVDLG